MFLGKRVWHFMHAVLETVVWNVKPYCLHQKGKKIVNQLKFAYHISPKYWDTLVTYHTSPKIWSIPFYYLLICLKYCCMYGKYCRPWSDAAFCGIWSGSTLFAKAYLSQYLGLLQKLNKLARIFGKSTVKRYGVQIFLANISKFKSSESKLQKLYRYMYGHVLPVHISMTLCRHLLCPCAKISL